MGLTLVLCTSVLCTGCQQEGETATIQDRWPDGKTMLTGEYDGIRRTGTWLEYRKNGALWSEVTYDHRGILSTCKAFDEQGLLAVDIRMKRNLMFTNVYDNGAHLGEFVNDGRATGNVQKAAERLIAMVSQPTMVQVRNAMIPLSVWELGRSMVTILSRTADTPAEATP